MNAIHRQLSSTRPTVCSSRPRRLLVHAGLHKTGTTALQLFLASVAAELPQLGVLYPRSGVNEQVHPGHHNIAWQITRDRRFVASRGTINDLAREVAGFEGDVILSSEDFESLIGDPERLSPLRHHPAFRECEFTVVIYVRNQSSYLESLFADLISQGEGVEFMHFAQMLRRDRQIRVREWTFQFDYASIHARWAACGWANLIVRNYHQLIGGSTIMDFCSAVCPDLAVRAEGANLWANARPTLRSSLPAFYANRVRRRLKRREIKAIERICNTLEERPVTLSNELRLALNQTFATANRTFCFAAGLPETGLVETGPAPVGAVPLERVFSSEVCNMIAGNQGDFDFEAHDTESAECSLFKKYYGYFHLDADYGNLAVTGLAKESGCIRGEIVNSIQNITDTLKSVLLPGENNAVKDAYAALFKLPNSRITTAGISEHVDFRWNFEHDPPRMGPFDCIVSQAMLEHLINPYKHVCDLYCLLENGGHLILHTHIPGFEYHRYPIDCMRFFPDWFEVMADRLGAAIVDKCIYERRILYHFRKP